MFQSYLDFNLIKSFAIVNTNNGSGHFWDNDHVSQVGFDNIGFLVDWALLLLLAKFLDKCHRLTLEATGDLPPYATREQFHKLLIVHIKELIQIDSTIGELTESPLLFQLCSSLNVIIQKRK